jgi:hypothetical protein
VRELDQNEIEIGTVCQRRADEERQTLASKRLRVKHGDQTRANQAMCDG